MDPGHDDALALLVALRCFPVRGVTTVAGNQTVDKTYHNARRVLFLAGAEGIPVARGSDRPLFRPLVVAENVHGATGLDGYIFPPIPSAPLLEAQSWLAETLAREADPVHWIATGPLTNVARFLMGHPHLASRIADITIMGGALNTGNITPHAEFNIYVDPDAAAYVFRSHLPVTMVGLNVTHQALMSFADVARFRDLGAPIGDMLYGLFSFFGAHEPHANDAGMPIHDVLAVAALAEPALFDWESLPIRVERCDDTFLGATRIGSAQQGDPIIRVAVNVNVPAFFDWLWRQLWAYGKTGTTNPPGPA